MGLERVFLLSACSGNPKANSNAKSKEIKRQITENKRHERHENQKEESNKDSRKQQKRDHPGRATEATQLKEDNALSQNATTHDPKFTVPEDKRATPIPGLASKGGHSNSITVFSKPSHKGHKQKLNTQTNF